MSARFTPRKGAVFNLNEMKEQKVGLEIKLR